MTIPMSLPFSVSVNCLWILYKIGNSTFRLRRERFNGTFKVLLKSFVGFGQWKA